MRVGVFTPLLSRIPLPAVLKKLAALQINTVELGTGNYVGDAHCKLSMLEDAAQLGEFKKVLADHGVTISALSCHGNPLHPEKARAQQDREVSRKTILLAEKLGIPVMIDFSGCPGDSPQATAPNWGTCPWPPDFLKVLDWQWNEVVAPYWIEHAKFAADHGVKIAVEMHPGFVVYNPETMLRLRSIAGAASVATSIPAISSGRTSIPSPPCACSKAPSSTSTPKTRSYTRQTYRAPASSTPSSIRKSETAVGFSALAATVTARSGGAS